MPNRFAHAQAVSEYHQDQEMIPDAVPALLHGVEERGDLRRAQEVFGALVAVGGLSTFDISPFGRGWRAHRNAVVLSDAWPSVSRMVAAGAPR
jgi:hypothetical protein